MMSQDAQIQAAMRKRSLTKATQTLLGICAGLTADGLLTDSEIHFLRTWLLEHPDVTGTWPGDLISTRIEAILADGIITEDERIGLLQTLQFISGNEFIDTGAAAPSAPAVPYDENTQIRFAGRTFCLTGTFFFGTRPACEQELIKRGAIPAGTVTAKLDYLVVGGGCSEHWINTTYGRKIETALERKKRYGTPSIISEKMWSAALLREQP